MDTDCYKKILDIGHIDPIPNDPIHPYWSVMIPVCGRENYIQEALESVLSQGIEKGRIQVCVVENCCRNDNIKNLVIRIGSDRVEYYQQPKDVSANENWNTCIRLARGKWIHILHDDDYVLPGFYKSYEKALVNNPDLEALFGPSILVDKNRKIIGRYSPGPIQIDVSEPNIMNFRKKNKPHPSCASNVTSRQLYERIGGFSLDISFSLDFEMWMRALAFGRIGWTSFPASAYRVHAESGSAKDFNNHRRQIAEILLVKGIVIQLFEHRLRFLEKIILRYDFFTFDAISTPYFIRDGGTINQALKIFLSNFCSNEERVRHLKDILALP